MTARKKILIVDDEETITWGISKSLAKPYYNFEVTCVHAGDEALKLLRRKKFDLVVSDIRMPGRNGMQLILDIRQNFPHTKIIIMTAYGSPKVKDQVENRGGFFYIEKPFDIGYLRQIICEALDVNDKGFKGYIESAGIRELVEYNCARKRDASLMITQNKEQGTIYFKNGDIIHAECGDLIGERAFFNMLNWSTGTFKIMPHDFKIKRTIVRDCKSLLHQCI
ncbi:MAG: response regulator [bacterium]